MMHKTTNTQKYHADPHNSDICFSTVPAVISFSPTRMSFREKGVEAYLFLFFQKCLFLFLVTRLRGWYRSASLRLGTGINLPVSPTCFTKFLVAAVNISSDAWVSDQVEKKQFSTQKPGCSVTHALPGPFAALVWRVNSGVFFQTREMLNNAGSV